MDANRQLVLFNKPFNVLSQFTDQSGRQTLKDFIDIKGVYPCGRLDKDSEGLLILTNYGKLQNQLSSPKYKKEKSYLVQVEGLPSSDNVDSLVSGMLLKDGMAMAKSAKLVEEPNIWPRVPPIRYRKNIPTQWLEIVLTEGRNRQVRRMTAAIGYPTLRLVRNRIANYELEDLQPGEYTVVNM